MIEINSVTEEGLLNVIENEAGIKIDSFVEGAIELSEEVHSEVHLVNCYRYFAFRFSRIILLQ